MAKRTAKTEFETRLKEWQAKNGFTAKQAADFMEVPLATYRHWIYNGVVPSDSKCLACIEAKMKGKPDEHAAVPLQETR